MRAVNMHPADNYPRIADVHGPVPPYTSRDASQQAHLARQQRALSQPTPSDTWATPEIMDQVRVFLRSTRVRLLTSPSSQMHLITTDISPDNLSISPAQYNPPSKFEDTTYDDTNTTFFTDLHRDGEVKAVTQANAAVAKRSRTTSDANLKPSGHVKRAKTGEEKENKPLTTKPLRGRAAKAHREALAAQGKAALEDDAIVAAGRPWSDEMKSNLFTYILSPENDDTFHTFKKNPDRVYRKVKCLYLIKYLSTYLIIRLQLTCTKTRSRRAL